MPFFRFLTQLRCKPSHMSSFSRGAGALLSRQNYDAFILSSSHFGRPHTGPGVGPGEGFVAPWHALLNEFSKSAGEARKLEQLLGLDKNSLGNTSDVVLAHVPFPQELGLRRPSGNEQGANDQFVEGGRTSGGMEEGVIDRVQTAETPFMPSDQEGLVSFNNVRFFNASDFMKTSWATKWLLTQAAYSLDENSPHK